MITAPKATSALAGQDLACNNIDLAYDGDLELLWASLAPKKGPFFSSELLDELGRCVDLLTYRAAWATSEGNQPIRYVVVRSKTKGRFNLGGDLSEIETCVRAGDRDALARYARKCIDVLFRWNRVLGARVTTIALVQGKALGGGFECALGCHYIVAEETATFGFPEALFNMFPGMGGYSFLVRKVGTRIAEDLMAKGNQCSAAALHSLGIVDAVADTNKGAQAVEVFIREHRARATTRRAIERMRAMVMPITYEELESIVALWVESAFSLTERDLRKLRLLIEAQAAEVSKEVRSAIRAV